MSPYAVPCRSGLAEASDRSERAAQRPQDFSVDAKIAGAALQPIRDTRPLLQGTCMSGTSARPAKPLYCPPAPPETPP
ncbi:hypothetical protein DMX06_14365 [Pseudomonas mosselii]|nr:hypothetical protein DMX06_14365 [Pseudomonas mosselii]